MWTTRLVLVLLAVICFGLATFKFREAKISWRDAGFGLLAATLLTT